MKRRDTLKSLLVGGVAGATLGTSGCKVDGDKVEIELPKGLGYGRTPTEEEHDKSINSEQFYNEHELTTIATLCDIILPPTPTAGSATDAEVPAFIEFISKDLPSHQIPIRGGLMWIDGESNKRFNKRFISCSDTEQTAIVDDIAYPDPDGKKPEMGPGIEFFKRMRNLTLTGYYTTKIGMDDLGYVGNRPNAWDGVPQDVLDKHGMSYPKEWMAKFVDQSKRDVQAEWDELGNLLT